MSLNYLALHPASFHLEFIHHDRLSESRFNASEQGCTLSSSMTDDHNWNTKPHVLRYPGLNTCVEIIHFSASKAKTFKDEPKNKEEGSTKLYFLNFSLLLFLQYHYSWHHLTHMGSQPHGLQYLENDAMRRQAPDYQVGGSEPMTSKGTQYVLWDTR